MFLSIRLLLASSPLLWGQAGGTVEGTVVDSLTRSGIPAVAVELAPAGSRSVALRAVTDSAGAFRIAGVAPGDYIASFDKQGYGGPFSGGGSARPAHVGAEGGTVRLATQLTRLGGLSGRVMDGDGRAVPNLPVQLKTSSELASTVLMALAKTDQDGRFSFQGLWPGGYLLEAQPIRSSLQGGMTSGSASKKAAQPDPPLAPPPAGEGERLVWANTFYPNVVERSQAARIAVRAGWDLTGYDIRLQAVPVYRLRGVVFGDDGKLAAGVEVGIASADRWEHDSDGTRSADDGSFEFPAVHLGKWLLTAAATRGGVELKGFAETIVARHDLETVAIRLAAPFRVGGSVELQERRGAGGEDSIDSVTLESITRNWSAPGHPRKDGTFEIDGLFPDRYRIVVYGLPDGYYVESILLGAREVMEQEVEIGPGFAPLRVIYTAGAGRVSGSVEEGDGVTVVLLPADETMLTYQFIRTAKCDSRGRFEIGSVKPGDYYAFAFPQPEINALEDPDFVRPLIGSAVRVRVDRDRAATADLKVTPWPE